MSDFFQASFVTTENGEVVEQQNSPIIEVKKLNGQGTLYKLIDANYESINAQQEKNGIINVDKFIRSVRTNFGNNQYNVSAITHMPMPNQLMDIAMLRVEVNSKVDITSSNHYWNEVSDYHIFVCMEEGVVLELNSWYGIIKKASEEGELNEEFLKLCNMVVEQAPSQVAHFFEDTMFDSHLDEFDKITIVRDRVYD